MTVLVELRQAFEWTCDHCGRDQFERAMVPEMSAEDAIEVARELGVIGEFDTDVPEGSLVCAPDGVTCHSCGATYLTACDDDVDD